MPIFPHTQIGFEVEIDYFKNDEFGLHEVEIEPTIRYKKEIKKGEYKIELEMPIFRIHNKNKNKKKDDFKYEGMNITTSYRLPLNDNKKTHLKISLELPYDAEKKELREKFFISLRQKFN